MVSIKEVAKAAGVSITTVSRALNNYPDVSPKTKKKVLEVCSELNYSPNLSARNLALKRSNVIGFIFSDVKETDMHSNIIYRLLLGAQAGCEERSFELIVLFINRKKQESKSLGSLCKEKNIGSAVIYGLKSTDPYYHQIGDIDFPCIGIDVEKATAVVGTNNDLAVEDIITLFRQHGREKICMINGSFDADISRIREKAFIRTMKKMDLELQKGSICYADFLEEKAYTETIELLKRRPETDAIFAASDLMAIGVLRAMRKLHKSVPKEVAVSGIDGIQVGAYMDPPLTTIKQDFKAMGYKAILMIADIQSGKSVNYVEYVPHELIIRKTV